MESHLTVHVNALSVAGSWAGGGMAANQIIGFMEADTTMKQSPVNTAVQCLCTV